MSSTLRKMYQEIQDDLPGDDEREMLQELISVFEQDGSSGVRKYITQMIDELRGMS